MGNLAGGGAQAPLPPDRSPILESAIDDEVERIEPLGIELDHAACETRRAAGLATAEADVTTLDPADFAPCDLLIASPPCQGFSTAGKRDPRDPRNTGCVVRAE
jgi:hypothetical protein